MKEEMIEAALPAYLKKDISALEEGVKINYAAFLMGTEDENCQKSLKTIGRRID